MAAPGRKIAQISVYGWIRLDIEQQYCSLIIPDALKHLCSSFYTASIRFDENTKNKKWTINNNSDNLKAARIVDQGHVGCWVESNIYADILLRPNTGKYQWKVKFNKVPEFLVIGIVLQSQQRRTADNFFTFNGSYVMENTGQLIGTNKINPRKRDWNYNYAYNSDKEAIKTGDIVHVLLDTDEMNMEYMINDTKFGIAFEDIPRNIYVFGLAVWDDCQVEIVE